MLVIRNVYTGNTSHSIFSKKAVKIINRPTKILRGG